VIDVPEPTVAPPADWADEVAEALRAEAGAVRRLRELAERQGGLVAAGRLDTARALVRHRATVLEEIRGHGSRVRALAAAGAAAPPLDAARAAELRALQRSIRDDLRVVAERDAEDRARLAERRAAVGGELGRVDEGRRARRAYAGRPAPAPRFEDETA